MVLISEIVDLPCPLQWREECPCAFSASVWGEEWFAIDLGTAVQSRFPYVVTFTQKILLVWDHRKRQSFKHWEKFKTEVGQQNLYRSLLVLTNCITEVLIFILQQFGSLSLIHVYWGFQSNIMEFVSVRTTGACGEGSFWLHFCVQVCVFLIQSRDHCLSEFANPCLLIHIWGLGFPTLFWVTHFTNKDESLFLWDY